MHEFIKIRWILRKFTEAQVAACVTKGYITQDEATEILSMTQVAE